MHKTFGSLAALALAAFAAAPLPAAAADSTLSACVGQQAGVMRFTDAGTGCRSGEKLVTWNVQGPQGATGPQGPQGPAGTQSLINGVIFGNGEIMVVSKPPGSSFTVTRTQAGRYHVRVDGLGNTCPLPMAMPFSNNARFAMGGGVCYAGALEIDVYNADGLDADFVLLVTALNNPTTAAARTQAVKVLQPQPAR